MTKSMMRINLEMLRELAATANLAPSVHNTQPARWALDSDGSILLAADLSRQLSIGDPQARDMGLSCGTALEGMAMALAARGLGVVTDDLWNEDIRSWRSGYRLVARLAIDGGASESEHAAWIEKRFTWRGAFGKASPEAVARLQAWAATQDDVTLAYTPDDLALIAALNDKASLAVMRDRAFRRELVDWMRLSPSHPAYRFDGLNLEALRMGKIEGAAAGRLLPSRLFDGIDRLGLAGALVAEAGKTLTAAGCALFYRPADETPVQSGRAFYRFWLGFTRFGLAGWPMAALADVDWAAAQIRDRFAVPAERRLINILRIGPPPQSLQKYRLPPADLLLDDRPA